MKSGASNRHQEAMRRYALTVTGKTAEELSAMNPDDEIQLATAVNGVAPAWPTRFMGAFRGRGNINIAKRRLKTIARYDEYLEGLVASGARQY